MELKLIKKEQKKLSEISSIISQNPILISNTLFEHLKSTDKDLDTSELKIY